MKLKRRIVTALSGLVVVGLIGCGNKGDLYLAPDEFTQQELLRLEQNLQQQESAAGASSDLTISDQEPGTATEDEKDPQKKRDSNSSSTE